MHAKLSYISVVQQHYSPNNIDIVPYYIPFHTTAQENKEVLEQFFN